MERLKAGYEKLKGEINHVVAAPVMQKLMPVHGRQHGIGSRVVAENRQISEGGFAFVFLVHDVKTNEELVLKKMRCQDKASLAMAKREIQLLEQLPPHPNLVQYYGSIFLSEGKCKEVAMLFEFCPGGHLLNLLDKAEGRLTEKVILETMTQIVTGVAVLHSFSPPVQHRDLKVENVLLGADGQWKLLDFGSWSDERLDPGALDKHALSQLEEQIEKYTTMMYRPPEMVDFYLEFPISQKVDIWMIGCILYTLMFYRHPFQDESTLAIANARYVWPSTPEYPEHLRDLTHWLLARDPEDRPDAELLLDILGTCSSESSGTPPMLPLPKAVQEQCEKLRRLYGEGRGTSPSRVESPASRSQCDGVEDERKRSKPRKGRQNSKKRTNDEWVQADTAWPVAATVPEPSSSWAAFGRSEEADPSTSPSQPISKSAWPTGHFADFTETAHGEEEVGQSTWSFSTHATSSGSQSPVSRAQRGLNHRGNQRGWETDAFAAQWPEVREEPLWPPPVEAAERSSSTSAWPKSADTRAESPHQSPWGGASPSQSPRALQVPAATAWPTTVFTPFLSPWDNTPVASPRSSERSEMPTSPSGEPKGGSTNLAWPAEVFNTSLAPWPDEPGGTGHDNPWAPAKKVTPWTQPSDKSPVASTFVWPAQGAESPSAAAAWPPRFPSPWDG